jgi:hypothetical protein
MAKRALVHCRICKACIDRDNQTDWVEPSPKWFYHASCYEDFAKKKGRIREGDIEVEVEDDIWKDAIFDYFKKDLKVSLNYPKFLSQWDSLIKKGRTGKGIYFALRYFYEVAKGDPTKSENGIGIVAHIYEESANYWHERKQHDEEVLEKIEAQIRASQDRRVTRIVRKEKTVGPKVKTYSFEDIENMEDEE